MPLTLSGPSGEESKKSIFTGANEIDYDGEKLITKLNKTNAEEL